MPDEKRRAETGGERRLRLGDAHFGAGDFGGVAGDEMIHRLLRIEFRDRRQHAEGIAREEDDVGRVTGDARDLRVADELDRIGAARVLREAGVAEIDVPVFGIEDDVLQHRAEVERVEDFRLGFRGQVDRLRVATALDVEDAVVGPDVFVVADELALRIGGERRLARAGKAEEHRGAAALRIRRRRAVHGKMPAFRHDVVHHGEDALLHFAGVFGAEDDQLFVLERQVDGGRRGHPFGEAIGGKLAGVVDDEIGLAEVGEFFRRRPDHHGVHEERVVRPRADDADFQPMLRGPAGEAIDDVEALAGVEVVLRALAVDEVGVFVERGIHRSPPDFIFRRGTADDPFVQGRTAGLFPRRNNERSGIRYGRAGIVPDRLLVEPRG